MITDRAPQSLMYSQGLTQHLLTYFKAQDSSPEESQLPARLLAEGGPERSLPAAVPPVTAEATRTPPGWRVTSAKRFPQPEAPAKRCRSSPTRVSAPGARR